MKKLVFALLSVIALVILGFFVFTRTKSNEHPSIVTSNFAAYDFARAVTGSSQGIKLLVQPGTDIHNFEPTPEDIISIKNANLFIYNGGESESWVEKIIEDNNIPAEKTLRLMNLIDLKTEEIKTGMDVPAETAETATETTKVEYDEHIWTSIPNAIKMLQEISAKLSQITPQKSDEYAKNTQAYIAKLEQVDSDIRTTVANSKHKELIFADRFPFRYFTDEYGLDYYAAFPGCAEQTEASSATIAFLIDKVKTDGLSTILKIDISNDNLANTIAEATGAKILELNAAHNVTPADFNSGRTYLDIMAQNQKVLEETLN